MVERASDYLSPKDLAEARRVGLARYARATTQKRSQPFGDPGDDQRKFIDCYSALAECAVANWLDLPWRNELVDDLSTKPPDVGNRLEVRWTKYPFGFLIGHDSDVDDWMAVCVRGPLPDMEIKGWTTTRALKQVKYRENPLARSPLDYWMPASDLYSTEMLYQMRAAL